MMKTCIVGLAKASHFGPTLIVTTISWFFAAHYWWEGPAFVIAVGVFCGQLVVGWSNDLIDYRDDHLHNRLAKPLISEHSKVTSSDPFAVVQVGALLSVILTVTVAVSQLLGFKISQI